VALPLLQAAVVAPGWVTNEAFLAGYGVAQASARTTFTFAAAAGSAEVVQSVASAGLGYMTEGVRTVPWLHFMAQNATIRPLKQPIQANTQSHDTCTFI